MKRWRGRDFPKRTNRFSKGGKRFFPDGRRYTTASSKKNTKLLTAREYQIALFLVDGKSYKEIAESMHISLASVNYSLQMIREKLGVIKSRDLVRFVKWNQTTL